MSDADAADDSTQTSHSERMGRRVALLATLGYAALIVFVSLVPATWSFEPSYWKPRILTFVNSVGISPRAIHSLRDLATNFVLYVPLGVLLPWVLPRGSWLRFPGMFVGAALSIGLEGLQCLTDRYPSAWDVATNALGHGVAFLLVTNIIGRRGLTAALFVGKREGTPRQRLAAGLLIIYASLLVLLALMPFDVTVSGEQIWRKLDGTQWRGGHIWLDPFGPWPAKRISGLPTALLLLAPVGFLSAVARQRRSLLRGALLAVFVATLVEGLQLLIRSRSSDVAQILAAGVGGAIGVALGRLWDPEPSDAAQHTSRRERWIVLTALYALFLWALGWRPFVFVASLKEAGKRMLLETEWFPLHAYMSSERSLAIWRDLGREAGWWAPLGVLLEMCLRGSRRIRGIPHLAFALALVFVWGMFIELGQSFIVGRQSDTTDVVSHLLGAAAGFLIGSALRRDSGHSG